MMSAFKHRLPGVLLGALLVTVTVSATAQPPGAPSDDNRQERIREHQARIQKIIEESRKRREAQNFPQAPAKATPAPPGNPANPAGGTPVNNAAGLTNRPGQQLPTGPVQNARLAPPVKAAQATPAPQAPQSPRSESRTILMFHPIDSIVSVGERFKTDVVAETKEGQVDEISYLIRYPRHKLNPLGLDHSMLDKYADGKLSYEFDPDKGTIYLHAKLKKPTRFLQQAISSIIWEALEPTDGSVISYEFGEKNTTGMYLNGSNLLGTLPGAEDGVIRTTVQIIAPKSDATVTRLSDKGLIIGSAPKPPEDDRPQDQIFLKLAADTRQVKVGETYDIDIVVHNPGNKLIDRVQVYAQFNPEEVEVLDNDIGNIVTRDVNIQDGPYRENFPFNFNRYNYADNKRGVIVYDVSASNSNVRGDGVLARIKLKALKDSPRADLVLVQNAEGLTPTSDVSFLGKSFLKQKPADLAQALSGTSVHISGKVETTGHIPAPNSADVFNPFESSLAQRMRKIAD